MPTRGSICAARHTPAKAQFIQPPVSVRGELAMLAEDALVLGPKRPEAGILSD